MKTKLLILAASVMLSGCFYQSVDASDLLKAEHFCKNHRGILSISSTVFGDEHITCIDGARWFADKTEFGKEYK